MTQGLLIAVGRLGRPHGTRGEIKLSPYFGHEQIAGLVGQAIFIETGKGRNPESIVLASARPADKISLVRIKGIETPEEAKAHSNTILLVPREQMPSLPEGHYYHEEIVGLPVFDPEGGLIGELTGFFEAGSADVWIIKSGSGEEILNPCLPDTLLEVDLDAGRIVMKLMETE